MRGSRRQEEARVNEGESPHFDQVGALGETVWFTFRAKRKQLRDFKLFAQEIKKA
jgi:hypothetical protein